MKQRILKILKEIAFYVVLIVATVIVTVFIKMTVFANYVVPTSSMEPAIMAGDKIIVGKLVLGGRIVRNFFSHEPGDTFRISRFPGLRKVRRNDVLVFNYPATDWNRIGLDLSINYAKRCVAIPGDTFYIERGIYKVKGLDKPLGSVEKQQAFAQMPDTLINESLWRCFPFDDRYDWNVKNFGPLYIPGSGDRIVIDTMNVVLYNKVLEYETHKQVSVRNGRVYLNDSVITDYTFRKNYYFMAGDHVFDSRDSRYWGLLPEENIVGKISYIWNNHNKQTGKTSWKRFLHAVE
ncbi:MAG: signal peptidase I [Prevotellaceae bacterium]|jgi:signal peptidase I|nr:signal peptidase I [Prevotellaceae bacterium]